MKKDRDEYLSEKELLKIKNQSVKEIMIHEDIENGNLDQVPLIYWPINTESEG